MDAKKIAALPPNLPAWLDQMEAYCNETMIWLSDPGRLLTCACRDRISTLSSDLPLAVTVIRGLMKALRELTDELEAGAHTLYQQKAILKTDRNWLLGKVQKARAAFREARNEGKA